MWPPLNDDACVQASARVKVCSQTGVILAIGEPNYGGKRPVIEMPFVDQFLAIKESPLQPVTE